MPCFYMNLELINNVTENIQKLILKVIWNKRILRTWNQPWVKRNIQGLCEAGQDFGTFPFGFQGSENPAIAAFAYVNCYQFAVGLG